MKNNYLISRRGLSRVSSLIITGLLLSVSVFGIDGKKPFSMSFQILSQQQINGISVKGKVVDTSGEPIYGAQIAWNDANGKLNRVASDFDGNFSITVPNTNTIITFSSLGFNSVKVTVGNKKILNIVLEDNTKELEEVVVVGYGAQKKTSVVGAVQTVKAKTLKVPSASLSSSFAGRIAGIVSVQRGGQPGADGANFWIRGISTFAGPTSPLIYIDGVEVSSADLNALSPEVIEGFSILKDATATALYGARGANGVMLITTRQGRSNERASINIRIENSFTAPTKLVKMGDAIDYMEGYNFAQLTRLPDMTPRFSKEQIDGVRNNLDPTVYPNVDWMNFLFKDFTSTQGANLNVSGGTEKVTYFLSASLNNDNGMFKKDPLNKFDNNVSLQRMAFQANIGAMLTPTTKVSIRMNSRLQQITGSSSSVSSIYNAIFEAPPALFLPVYPEQQGDHHIRFGNADGGPVPIDNVGTYRNPYATMVSGYSNTNSSTIITSLVLDQDLKFITPGLKLKSLVSFKNWTTAVISRSFKPYYYTIDSFSENPQGGYDYELKSVTKGTTALAFSKGTNGDRMTNFQTSLDYARTFANLHDLSAMAVYSMRDYNSNNPSDFYNSLPTRNQAISGRVTYAYDNRYMIEGNFGFTGTENFAKGKRFGIFPSVAAGYNISNEEFFKPLTNVITNLKIRGSWGIVGNSFTNPRFPYLTFVNLNGRGYTFGDDWQSTANGAVVTKFGADNARWERGIKSNIGIDAKLFNSLGIALDLFQETRSDIFMQRNTIPAESGITGNLKPYANLGKVKNKGFDLSLDYNQAISKDLSINTIFNVTYSSNTLIDRDEPRYPENESYRSDLGKSLFTHKGLIADGFFKDEDDIKNSPEHTYSKVMPGDIKYKDLNGDGKVDDSDMQLIGNPTIPKLTYGFGSTVNYKKFDFSFFFQGIGKTSLMMSQIHPFSSEQSTILKFIADDYWTEDNKNAAYPRLISGVNDHNNFKNSTFWLRDGSFVRLKSVEFGFTHKFTRAYISGQNLLTFSPFKHWDPELGGGNGLKYPNLRVGTIGLQFTF